MAKKTNKTSHVLNLITNGEPEIIQEPAKPAKPAVPEETTEKKIADTKVTVVNTDQQNSEVSEEIQKQLISQLQQEEEERKEAAAKEAEAKEAAAKEAAAKEAAEPVTAQAAEPQLGDPEAEAAAGKAEELPVTGTELPKAGPQAAPEPEGEEEPPAIVIPELLTSEEEQEQDSAALEEAAEEKPEEQTYDMVNVMEAILRRTDIQKYMRNYEVCDCSRCRADVLALVLTRLPAKYVVVDQTAISPMVSYYESRMRTRLLTEMIKSCMDVKERPRH